MLSTLGKQLTHFMGRLPYIKKFIALIVVFLIPLVVCCSFLLSEFYQRITFTQLEIQGAEYLQGLSGFKHALYLVESNHKGKILRNSSDPAYDPKTLDTLIQTASQRLQEALELDNNYGDQLDTQEELQEIQKLWHIAKAYLGESDNQTDWQRSYTYELNRKLESLTRKVGDSSNLILDPDLDTYYLMDTILITLHDLQNTLIQIERAFYLQPDMLQQTISAPSYAYQKLQEKIILLREIKLRLIRNLYTAFKKSPNQNTEQTLAPVLKELNHATQMLIIQIQSDNQNTLLNNKTVITNLQKTIAKSYELWDLTNNQLSAKLKQRISGIQQKIAIFSVITLLALLLAVALIYGFYQSVIKTVLLLDESTTKLLKGNLNQSLHIHTKDELSVIVKAFNQIMEQLRTECSKAVNETERARKAVLYAQAQEEKSRTLALIASRTTNGVIITDANGYIEWVNDGFERISGYSLHEVKGRKPGDFLQGEETSQATIEFLRRKINAQSGVQADLINYTKDGTPYWIHLDIQPLFDHTGQLTQFMAIETDITERKQIEQALQKSEKLFKGIFNSAPDCVLGVDQNNRILFVNPATDVLFGYHPGELIEHQLDKLLPNSSRTHHWKFMKAFAEGKEPRLHMTNRQVNAKKKDGSEFPIEVSISKVQLDNEVIFTAILRDVTQQREYEKRLQDALALTKSILDASTLVAMIATDQEGTITVFNSGAEHMLGYKAEEFVGQRSPAILHLEDEVIQRSQELTEQLGVPIEGFETFVALARRGKYEEREWTYVKKNGDHITVSLSITAIQDAEGEITGFLGIAKDITENRRTLKRLEEETLRASQLAEQAQAANIAKSQFLANMSHEIRTPMNGVLGMSQLLKLTELTPKQQEYLDAIQSSGEMLLTVLNDILDFSKIEAGKLTIEAIEFDLFREIKHITKLFNSLAEKKGLELILNLPVSGPRAFKGDEVRIKQVLTNLISNAIKFTSEGHVLVQVETTPTNNHSHSIAIKVQDTGIGIPADKVGQLFQEFTQVDASTTRKYGGTGLGLSISHKLISLMGGSMEVTSEEGQGSCFSFKLQLPAVTVNQSHPPKELSKVRALVVDDNPMNLQVLGDQLRHWNLKVSLLQTPEHFFTHYQASEFDVLILDHLMPIVSGLDILQKVRESLPAIPIILISSVDMNSEIQALNMDPHFSYLPKPIDPDHLYECLIHLLSATEEKTEIKHKNTDTNAKGTHTNAKGTNTNAKGTNTNPTDMNTSLEDTRNNAKKSVDTNAFEFTRFSGHVLLVEDTPINQMLGLEILNNFGVTVDLAENGQEALDKITNTNYDLVFMDCLMPVMDGYQSTRQVRIAEAESDRHTPICALTANALQDAKYKCQAAGMDDFVSKPFKPQELVTVLNKWLPTTAQ
ncbi:PAS domain S-box protein [Litoribrevibacter albus]|uniref:histidine kinase n=1 Tax=Litoribrevibacter albus TaxID=1473156 RepID=A0AA37SEW5_9GAMM|nr:PAS domain S-box protein [Litoribrevibacter albus]GLQ32659.1 hypothetical protein GCM10007876_31380 [Litoribrevibacter albus]